MNNSDTPALDKFHEILRKELIDQGKVRTCINCEYFEDSACSQFGAVPPPKIIVYGCPFWLYLPF